MADGQKSLMHKMRDSKPYMIFEMVMMAGMFSMWALGPAGFFTNMATSLWSGLQHVPAALATMGQGALNLAHGAGFLTSVNMPAGLAASWMPAAAGGGMHMAGAGAIMPPTGMEMHAGNSMAGLAGTPGLQDAWMQALSPDLQSQFQSLSPGLMEKFNHLSGSLKNQFLEQLPLFTGNGLSLGDAVSSFCMN